MCTITSLIWKLEINKLFLMMKPKKYLFGLKAINKDLMT